MNIAIHVDSGAVRSHFYYRNAQVDPQDVGYEEAEKRQNRHEVSPFVSEQARTLSVIFVRASSIINKGTICILFRIL